MLPDMMVITDATGRSWRGIAIPPRDADATSSVPAAGQTRLGRRHAHPPMANRLRGRGPSARSRRARELGDHARKACRSRSTPAVHQGAGPGRPQYVKSHDACARHHGGAELGTRLRGVLQDGEGSSTFAHISLVAVARRERLLSRSRSIVAGPLPRDVRHRRAGADLSSRGLGAR